jgi:hypothetical protein
MLGLFSTVSVGRNGVSGLRHGAQRGGWQIALVGAIALLSVSNASAALQHQWTFEGGNANDPIGGANGTLMNGAVVTGGALVLTGGGAGAGATSPHATLPGPTIAINTFTSGLTLELWMTGSVENQWIWGAGLGRTSIGENEETAGQGYDYLMMNTSRQPAVEGSRMAISNGNFNGEAGVTDPSMDDLGDGLVHHVVLTVDPGAATPQMEYFLDGASIGTAALGDISIANLSNDTAYLGRSLYDGDSVFTGSIHEFSIYDNPFDLATAQANFTTGPVGGVPGVGPALEIDRDTGNVRLTNDQGSVSVVAYTINSAAGAIANANWASVANTGDSNSGGSIDPDDVWTIVTDTPNEISEADLVGGVGPDDGFALGTEQSLGNGLWTKSPFEDFTASLTTYDGVNELTFNAPVFFVGNNDLPFNIADFNLDNAVNEPHPWKPNLSATSTATSTTTFSTTVCSSNFLTIPMAPVRSRPWWLVFPSPAPRCSSVRQWFSVVWRQVGDGWRQDASRASWHWHFWPVEPPPTPTRSPGGILSPTSAAPPPTASPFPIQVPTPNSTPPFPIFRVTTTISRPMLRTARFSAPPCRRTPPPARRLAHKTEVAWVSAPTATCKWAAPPSVRSPRGRSRRRSK